MKKIGQFIDLHLGYFLVVPALIFILIFSIIPIAESLQYSFFDFQLNSQQKSGLYFTEHYNMGLFNETVEYLEYYLDSEKTVQSSAEIIEKIENLESKLPILQEEMHSLIGTKDSIVLLDVAKIDSIREKNLIIMTGLDDIYQSAESSQLQEDIYAVASELETALIPSNFIGLENFKTVVNDGRARHSLVITVIFTAVSVAFEFILGLVLAMIMNKAMRGQGLIRTFSLIPWAIPTSVAALIWAYLFNGSNGIVAVLLEKLGLIVDSTDLLLTGSGALSAIIMADVWKTTPYMALLLLAGLQTIPFNLYEASAIDGASKWKQFVSVTLPLLKPSIMVALLFRTLDAFRVFDLIYVLTGGGPGGQTESISIYAYKTMFAQTRFGYGSALVLIMALVVGIISYFYIRFLDVKMTAE
jgi:multiple sugar transport system permease protein